MRRLAFLPKALLAVSASLALLSAIPAAQATDLTGSMGADNGAYIYLSASPSSLGTLIGQAANWSGTALTSTLLSPGNTYYLHVETYNVGGPGGFIGSFSLSDSKASFSNGTQSLNTNTADWTGAYNSSLPNGTATPSGPPATWVVPTYSVSSAGTNGVAPWNTVSGVASNAQWIWPNDVSSGGAATPCGYCYVDFASGPITVQSAAPAGSSQGAKVPEPLGPSLITAALIGLGVSRRKNLSVSRVAGRLPPRTSLRAILARRSPESTRRHS